MMSRSACASEVLGSCQRQTRIAPAGVAALVLVILLLPTWPAVARAAGTVTLGPSLPTGETPQGSGDLKCFSAAECTYFTERSSDFTVAAPAPGTITSWSVEEFSGSAELIVLQPDAGGAYSVVAQSAKESEPCTANSNNEYCIPVENQVYTFQTDLPIAAGQVIGINALNSAGCETVKPIDCTIIGGVSRDGGSQAFLNPTPALNTPTVPYSYTASPFTVNAVEQTTPSTELVKTPTEAERLKEIEECPPASAPASLLTAPPPPSTTPVPSSSTIAHLSGVHPIGAEPPAFCERRTKYSAAEKKRAAEWGAFWTIESANLALVSTAAGASALAAGLIPEPTASKGFAAAQGSLALFAAAASAYYSRQSGFMAVIAADPPDPNWQTMASPPATHPGGLPKVPGLSKRGQRALASYMGALLSETADAECESEAIDRATTALANEDESTVAAQYRAGAACAASDVQTIKGLPKLSSAVKPFVPVLEKDAKDAGGERSLSKHISADERNPKFRQKAVVKTIASLKRMIALPESVIASLRSELSRKVRARHELSKKEFRAQFATPPTEGSWQVLQEQSEQTMAAAGAL